MISEITEGFLQKNVGDIDIILETAWGFSLKSVAEDLDAISEIPVGFFAKNLMRGPGCDFKQCSGLFAKKTMWPSRAHDDLFAY